MPSLNRTSRLLWPIVLALFAAASLPAQQAVIDRADQGAPTRPAVPENPPSSTNQATDQDAGVQRIAANRKLPFKVTATFDEQLYATNNVFLTPADSTAKNATILATTALVRVDGLAHSVGQTLLTPSVSFIWQRYLHGITTTNASIEDLDFDSFSLPVSASLRFGTGWEATATFTSSALYSVLGSPAYELLFRSYAPSLALRKIFEIKESRYLIAGLTTTYADTWTSASGVSSGRNDRADLALDLAYLHLAGLWTLNPFARASGSHYFGWQEAIRQNYDREDLTLSTGLSLSYALKNWGSLRTFASYDWRLSDSNSTVDYAYDSGTAGLGVTLSVRY
ncbi:MAG: hypothetical protein NTU80_14395 [Verrucomicrobia bacterium]|nr:hypothetical protein [Verrucomicrobiota bacterium]